MSTLKVDSIIDSEGGNTTSINGVTPALASQAEAQTGTDNTKLMTPLRSRESSAAFMNVSGAAPVYACRAWVNFNGTGAVGDQVIRAGGNVASVAKASAGVYTVYFTTAMPDANYSAVVTSTDLVNNFQIGVSVTAMNASYFTFRCQSSNHAGYDGLFVNVAVFR
jgi:hypothetical protein